MMLVTEQSLILSYIMNNNSDREEIERFKRALNPCRTCGHLLMSHSFIKPYNGSCPEVDVKVTGEYKICKCKKFIPKDNLEFLEWVAANKQQEGK